MAALRSQQADCFLEFLQPSCTSCKQELFRSVALHCQVLWVTQNLINKTILQRQRKLVSNYLGSWRRYGNHCWKKSNNRYIVFASIFICFELGNREKASETTSSVGLWIQAIFLLSEHNLGHLLLWLSTNSCISDKNKKESKISSIAYIFRKSTHSSFFSCLLCRLWYLQGCVQCTKLPFEHWSWTSFHDLPWIWTFFYSFICLNYEIVTVLVRVGQKSSAFNGLSVFWYDLYRTGHIFYLLLHEFEQFFLNCSW